MKRDETWWLSYTQAMKDVPMSGPGRVKALKGLVLETQQKTKELGNKLGVGHLMVQSDFRDLEKLSDDKTVFAVMHYGPAGLEYNKWASKPGNLGLINLDNACVDWVVKRQWQSMANTGMINDHDVAEIASHIVIIDMYPILMDVRTAGKRNDIPREYIQAFGGNVKDATDLMVQHSVGSIQCRGKPKEFFLFFWLPFSPLQ
jgi:hypothetical protein